MLVSLALGIFQPITAGLLAWFVVHRKKTLGIYWWLRVILAMLAVALLLHAAQQWVLVFNYTPPRHWLWLPMNLSVNATIWAAVATDFYRSSTQGTSE